MPVPSTLITQGLSLVKGAASTAAESIKLKKAKDKANTARMRYSSVLDELNKQEEAAKAVVGKLDEIEADIRQGFGMVTDLIRKIERYQDEAEDAECAFRHFDNLPVFDLDNAEMQSVTKGESAANNISHSDDEHFAGEMSEHSTDAMDIGLEAVNKTLNFCINNKDSITVLVEQLEKIPSGKQIDMGQQGGDIIGQGMNLGGLVLDAVAGEVAKSSEKAAENADAMWKKMLATERMAESVKAQLDEIKAASKDYEAILSNVYLQYQKEINALYAAVTSHQSAKQQLVNLVMSIFRSATKKEDNPISGLNNVQFSSFDIDEKRAAWNSVLLTRLLISMCATPLVADGALNKEAIEREKSKAQIILKEFC